MLNSYTEMKDKHSKEYNNFSNENMFYAFNDEQFKEGMGKLNLNSETDVDKIYSTGYGGYILRTKSKERHEIAFNHAKEMEEAIKNDKDGTGFIKEMFMYELVNHEYCITNDLKDTLDALGLTIEEVNNNENISNGLKIAKREYLEKAAKLGY